MTEALILGMDQTALTLLVTTVVGAIFAVYEKSKANEASVKATAAKAETTEAIGLLTGDIKAPQTAGVAGKIPERAYRMPQSVKAWLLKGNPADVQDWLIRQINEAEARGYSHYILVGDNENYRIEWGGVYGIAYGQSGDKGGWVAAPDELHNPEKSPVMSLIVPRYQTPPLPTPEGK